MLLFWIVSQNVVTYSHTNYLSNICVYNYEWFIYPNAIFNLNSFILKWPFFIGINCTLSYIHSKAAQKNQLFFFFESRVKNVSLWCFKSHLQRTVQIKKKIKSRSKFLKISKTVKNWIFFKFFFLYNFRDK